MKKLLMLLILVILVGVGLFIYKRYVKKENVVSPLGNVAEKITEKPLDKYTFDRLRARKFSPTPISLGKVVKTDPQFTSQMFYYVVDGKKVSGLMNIPKDAGTYPVIIMFRGFVAPSAYTPGTGTLRTAEYFAQHGYITLAPDFLGYGESEKGSDDSIEDRFQTYTTALQLLSSVKTLNAALETVKSGTIRADSEKVGIWGHSNGGNISLSVLSITGKPYPTVLWNPVSEVFPYTVLYFIDEYSDHGKALIKVIADFEKDYDAEKYSPPNYYHYITAPIQLHQGLSDVEVPVKWSNRLNDKLKSQGLDITYFTWPGENHNFNNGSWSEIVQKSTDFYNQHLGNNK